MTDNTIRRVVSATNAEGVQTFVKEDRVTPFHFDGSHPESLMYPVWGLDSRPALPADGSQFDYRTAVAPRAGFRVEMFLLPPDGEAAAYERRNMGALMHQTPTLDVGYVVEGEAVVVLESGEERVLFAGDVYISHGVNHAWRNRGSVLCKMFAVLIGADHEDGPEWMKV